MRADVSLSSGVIWITGYSAAGKTTIGRKVEASLREAGLSTIFLDGDDLRSIFGGRWGYQREDRVELARVYFRLCSHLAAQGKTVIICAVAMYHEIDEWFHTNIPNAFEVYLRVPQAERLRRDAATKNIYAKFGNLAELYDEPTGADLVVENYEVRPDQVAEQIVAAYRSPTKRDADQGRGKHWAKFYSQQKPGPMRPSPFALAVAQDLADNSSILDFGCGNGRDAAFFAEHGHRVTALDKSEEAIKLCRRVHSHLKMSFVASALPSIANQLGEFDVVYSRFVFHAMTLDEELSSLSAAARVLRPDGKLFIECRSINDPLAREGEVISPTERIHGHYRRFIVSDELKQRVSRSGFGKIQIIESDGLAVHGSENPVVIRLMARKEVSD